MDSSEVITAIINGKLDDNLESISYAISQRLQTKAQLIALTLNVGDTIKFKNVRPKYLIDQLGIIKTKSPGTLTVDLIKPTGRFHKNITCKPDMIEKINA